MMASPYASLRRRLTTVLALCALGAFVSGAGIAAPAILPATLLLLLSLFWNPRVRLRRSLELLWRTLAVLLAFRAGYHALFVADDVVLPMVDLLLLLLLAETFRAQDGMGEARLYALTFALLIAAAAYRPGIVFGLAFIAYLAVLTVSLIVGQLGRQAAVRGLRPPPLTSRFLVQSAAFSGIALLVSLLVFLAFPRVSWGARAAPPLRNVVGFGDRVSLLEHGGRIYSNPDVVLRVEFPGGHRPPLDRLYWRGRSYDTFDGWTWSRTAMRPQALIEARHWPRSRVEQLIYQSSIGDANVLFGLAQPVQVTPRSRIIAYPELNGDFTYGGPAEPAYAVVSVASEPAPAALRAAAADSAAPVDPYGREAILQAAALRPYLRLPPLSPRVYALADSLARGRPTDYDRVLAVRDWLRGSFDYTVELPPSARAASLEYFLFQRRQGHCEYFSTAMAVLLRAMGIPARNVNGFLGGEWNEFGDFLTVTQNQAHSWVEVWFPGYGWVSFDPTPGSAAGAEGRSAQARWLAPFRLVFAGLEHRWGKWVLDYDLDDQGRMLADAVGRLRAATHRAGDPAQLWRKIVLAGFGVLLLAMLLSIGRPWRGHGTGRTPVGDVTRQYLRLRRAYRRLGFPLASPPLAFMRELQQAAVPGAAEAAGAVRLYARLRFGAHHGDGSEHRELRHRVTAALRSVRRDGMRRRWRGPGGGT